MLPKPALVESGTPNDPQEIAAIVRATMFAAVNLGLIIVSYWSGARAALQVRSAHAGDP